jgi:hypothetical protein
LTDFSFFLTAALITPLKVGIGLEVVVETGLSQGGWVVMLEVVLPEVRIVDELMAWSMSGKAVSLFLILCSQLLTLVT